MDWSFMNQLMGKVDQIISLLENILEENKKMSAQMDALVDAVHAENTVIDGAITLIQGLNTRLGDITANLAQVLVQLQSAQADTVALQAVNDAAVALHDEVELKATALAEAVAAVPPPA